jgi:biopolymer transport protein ExbD
MASMDTGDSGGSHKKGPGVKKAKKLSTRVDMTPMVDLGFLLITFFIFTTTMSTPTTVNLNMPKDTDKDEELTKTKQSGALTIMLSKENHVYYYEGQLEPDASNFKSTNFAAIRDIIINKKKEVISNYRTDPACEAKAKAKAAEEGDKNFDPVKGPVKACQDQDFVVVIKPTPEATYKNTVDILDEMTINQVKRYAIVDITKDELGLINLTEGGSGASATK